MGKAREDEMEGPSFMGGKRGLKRRSWGKSLACITGTVSVKRRLNSEGIGFKGFSDFSENARGRGVV